MPKVPALTESTRNIRVPDATQRAHDHGGRFIGQGVSAVGQGVQNLAHVMGQQQAQAELSEGTVGLEEDMARIKHEASFMEAVEAHKYVNDQVNASIEKHTSAMTIGSAQRTFAQNSQIRRAKFAGEFMEQVTAIQKDKVQVQTVKAYKKALAMNQPLLANEIITKAIGNGTLTAQAGELILAQDRSIRERALMIAAGDDLEKQKALNITENRSLHSDTIAKLKLRDQVAGVDNEKRHAYNATEDVIANMAAKNETDAGQAEAMIRAELDEVGGFTEIEIEKVVELRLKTLHTDAATLWAASGEVDIETILSSLEHVDKGEIPRLKGLIQSAMTKNETADQKWNFNQFAARIEFGKLEPQEIGKSLEGEARPNNLPEGLGSGIGMETRAKAFTTDLRAGGIERASLGDNPAITAPQAAILNGMLKNRGRAAAKREASKNRILEIIGERRSQPSSTRSPNMELAEDREAADIFYQDLYLVDRDENGEITHRYQKFEDMPVSKQIDLFRGMEDFAKMFNVLPPRFKKELEGTVMTGQDKPARIASQMIYPLLNRHDDRFNEKLMLRFDDDVLTRIDVYANEDEAGTEKRIAAEAKFKSIANLWNNASDADNVSNQDLTVAAFNKINSDGSYDAVKADAREYYIATVRAAYADNGYNLGKAMKRGANALNSRWQENWLGQRPRKDVFKAGTGRINKEQIADDVIVWVRAKGLGLLELSEAEVDDMMKGFDTQYLPSYPSRVNNPLYLQSWKMGRNPKEQDLIGPSPLLGGPAVPDNRKTLKNWSYFDKIHALTMVNAQAEKKGKNTGYASNFRGNHMNLHQASLNFGLRRMNPNGQYVTSKVGRKMLQSIGFLSDMDLKNTFDKPFPGHQWTTGDKSLNVDHARRRMFTQSDGSPRIKVDVIGSPDQKYFTIQYWDESLGEYVTLQSKIGEKGNPGAVRFVPSAHTRTRMEYIFKADGGSTSVETQNENRARIRNAAKAREDVNELQGLSSSDDIPISP